VRVHLVRCSWVIRRPTIVVGGVSCRAPSGPGPVACRGCRTGGRRAVAGPRREIQRRIPCLSATTWLPPPQILSLLRAGVRHHDSARRRRHTSARSGLVDDEQVGAKRQSQTPLFARRHLRRRRRVRRFAHRPVRARNVAVRLSPPVRSTAPPRRRGAKSRSRLSRPPARLVMSSRIAVCGQAPFTHCADPFRVRTPADRREAGVFVSSPGVVGC
jgi:hypothetical protein